MSLPLYRYTRRESMEVIMAEKRYLLMSIKPVYAQKIKAKTKTIELRCSSPKVSSGDILVIYESSPIQRITAYCNIDSVISMSPEKLWEAVKEKAGIAKDAFEEYFSGKQEGVGICLKNINMLSAPQPLSVIAEDFCAPQSYRYISEEQFRRIVSVGTSPEM